MNKFNRGYKLNKARRRNYLPIDTGNGTTYTVKKGDSPWAIAYSRGMSLDEFYRLNPKARNGIYAGDQVTFAAPNTKSYKVKKGDYPWKIAQDNGISLEDLYEYNPNAKKMIYPNDELRIPVKGDTRKLTLSSKVANDSNSNKAANSTPANGNAQPAPKDTTKSQVAPKATTRTKKKPINNSPILDYINSPGFKISSRAEVESKGYDSSLPGVNDFIPAIPEYTPMWGLFKGLNNATNGDFYKTLDSPLNSPLLMQFLGAAHANGRFKNGGPLTRRRLESAGVLSI